MDGPGLRISPDASRDEAAAIAAAIGAHLRDRASAVVDDEPEADTWAGRRWQLAGRLASRTGVARRLPRGVPRRAWTVAGRLERR